MALILCPVRGEYSRLAPKELFQARQVSSLAYSLFPLLLFLEEEKPHFYFLHFTHPFLLIKESNNPGGKTNG